MRVSRPCYDKYWRCPGWAGPGLRYAKRERCDSGSLARVINYGSRWWKLKIHRCPKCGLWILPYFTQWLSAVFWLGSSLDWWDNRHERRRERMRRRIQRDWR